MSTNLQDTIRDFLGNDERLIQRWANTDRETLAAIAGVNITGKMKEADSGFNFAEKIAELEEKDLMELRYQFREYFLDAHVNGSPNKIDSPLDDVIRGLVDILEAEIGGRWVR